MEWTWWVKGKTVVWAGKRRQFVEARQRVEYNQYALYEILKELIRNWERVGRGGWELGEDFAHCLLHFYWFKNKLVGQAQWLFFKALANPHHLQKGRQEARAVKVTAWPFLRAGRRINCISTDWSVWETVTRYSSVWGWLLAISLFALSLVLYNPAASSLCISAVFSPICRLCFQNARFPYTFHLQ